MRISPENRVPQTYDASTLLLALRDICKQLNGISEGVMHAKTNASTAAPTTGTYSLGDFVAKSDIVEAGGVGSKYVIVGWICVTGGTPGTWVESRTLTGN